MGRKNFELELQVNKKQEFGARGVREKIIKIMVYPPNFDPFVSKEREFGEELI